MIENDVRFFHRDFHSERERTELFEGERDELASNRLENRQHFVEKRGGQVMGVMERKRFQRSQFDQRSQLHDLLNFEIELEQIRTVTHDRVDRVLSHLNEREREGRR